MDRRRRSLAWTGVGSLGLDLYSCVKTLHVLGATVLFGTGAGVAFFMLKGHLSPAMRTPFFAMADIHRRPLPLLVGLVVKNLLVRLDLVSKAAANTTGGNHAISSHACIAWSHHRSDLRLYLPLRHVSDIADSGLCQGWRCRPITLATNSAAGGGVEGRLMARIHSSLFNDGVADRTPHLQ
jgi:Predicted integral membrane protein (DUF2269)